MNQNTNLLAQASHALRANDRSTARALLSQTLRADPANAEAWLLLSEAVEQPAQRRDCLERVLLLDPRHQQARLRLAALNQEPAPPPAPAFAPPAPAQPLASFGPPTQPIYPAQPPAGYGQAAPPAMPAVYPLGAADPMPVAAPRRKRPLWIDIPLALIVLFVGASIIASGLRAQREGAAAKPSAGKPAAVSAKPAAPTESAEQRATGFFNSLYGGMNDPRFYDPDQNREMLEPLAEEYFAPGASRSGLLVGLRIGMASVDVPEEDLEIMTSMIEEIRLKGAKYEATDRTATSVTLELVGGDLEMLAVDGEKYSTPVLDTGMTMELEMELVDGTWYIAMMSCGCETAK